jgi:murein tripeptide amidase MpaA
MFRIIVGALVIVISSGIYAEGQGKLLTRAESTDYTSTSLYSDVMVFISQLKKSSENLTVETIARSTEGRDIPLLIIGRPLPGSPEELLNDTRVVVYIQANIHAGEVEGKEASLMFARDILQDRDNPLLDHVILLICPIFNPDGNEKISNSNRPDQNGPVNGVGVRYNGQFLDLNRDAMKAESPEIRGLLTNVFNRWDPYVIMDCHTTDGSYHVEPVTFTWMVNPNGDLSLISYLRDKMMPAVSQRLLQKYRVQNCFYGEFIDMLEPEKGWLMEASEPRYMVNYVGLRNRLGILNENYIYADFKFRVLGCYGLIHSLVDYAAANCSEIKSVVGNADRRCIAGAINTSAADSFAVKYDVKAAGGRVTIMTYEAELLSEVDGRKRYRKTDRQKTVTVPYYIDYYPVQSVKMPFAYLLTVKDPEILTLLRIHGISFEQLTEDTKLAVRRFQISDLHCDPRLNQGHYINSISGEYTDTTADFPAGTIVIRMAQPLSHLAAYLLEPESGDGLLAWNFLDRYLVPQWGRGYLPYPVCKVLAPVGMNTEPVIR